MKDKRVWRRKAGRAGSRSGDDSDDKAVSEPRFSGDLQGILVTAASTDPYKIGRTVYTLLRSYADVFREAEVVGEACPGGPAAQPGSQPEVGPRLSDNRKNQQGGVLPTVSDTITDAEIPGGSTGSQETQEIQEIQETRETQEAREVGEPQAAQETQETQGFPIEKDGNGIEEASNPADFQNEENPEPPTKHKPPKETQGASSERDSSHSHHSDGPDEPDAPDEAAASVGASEEERPFDLFDSSVPLDTTAPTSSLTRETGAAPAAPTARDEIVRLRDRGRRFYRLKPGAKGTLFVGWPRGNGYLDPNEAVSRLLLAAREGKPMGEIRTAVPVLHTAKSRLGSVLHCAEVCVRDFLIHQDKYHEYCRSRAALQATECNTAGEVTADPHDSHPATSQTVPVELFLRIRNNNEFDRNEITTMLQTHLDSRMPGLVRFVEAYGAYVLILCITAGNVMLGMVENRNLSDFSFTRAASGL